MSSTTSGTCKCTTSPVIGVGNELELSNSFHVAACICGETATIDHRPRPSIPVPRFHRFQLPDQYPWGTASTLAQSRGPSQPLPLLHLSPQLHLCSSHTPHRPSDQQTRCLRRLAAATGCGGGGLSSSTSKLAEEEGEEEAAARRRWRA